MNLSHLRGAYGERYRPNHTLKHFLRPDPTPRAKPEGEHYQPELGQIGSWVRLPDDSSAPGAVGQVWSLDRGGKDPIVWVVDGEYFYKIEVRRLRPRIVYPPGPDTSDTGAFERMRII